MAQTNDIIMNNDEAEKSFFKLCELDILHIDKYTIEHNLTKWNLNISSAKLKGNQIQLDIIVPYAELVLEIEERVSDFEFLEKHTTRISISDKNDNNHSIFNYITGKTIPILLSLDVKYVIFSTPYFYPHNWYYFSNKNYLYNKILHSVNFMKYFIEAYKKTFQSGVPLMYIKEARERVDHYEIDIILKEYLTISYSTTKINIATIYFHLLLMNDGKSNNSNQYAKFHQITLNIPREIRTGNVYFKFTANII